MFNSSCHVLAGFARDFIITCLQRMLGWLVQCCERVSGEAGGAAVVPEVTRCGEVEGTRSNDSVQG